MSVIPEEAKVTSEDLGRWFEMQDELKKLKAKESLLRRVLFAHYFPTAKEGTNNYDLPEVNGVPYELKGMRKIDRKIDEAMLALMSKPIEMKDELSEILQKVLEEASAAGKPAPSELEAAGIDVTKLVRYKPELSVSAYRDLTDEQRQVFDRILDIKDGSPSMEIKPKSDRARAKKLGA